MVAAAKSMFLLIFVVIFPLFHTIFGIVPQNHKSSLIPNDYDFKNNLFCDRWKFNIETNDTDTWKIIPSECIHFVRKYMNGDLYVSELKKVAADSIKFASKLNLSTDGKDAWVFDIDETLLSNLPYFEAYDFEFDERSYKQWVDNAKAPALAESLNLYMSLKMLGYAIFLVSGRDEVQRNSTEKNLWFSGYSHWEKLILRGGLDKKKSAVEFKSEKRMEIQNGGYIIHGISGDQWSDLLGCFVAKCSFKLPNPDYYIA